jgi:hypothetical protein
MKKILLASVLLIIAQLAIAQNKCSHANCRHFAVNKSAFDNLRSDTIDVLDYKIYLDITDFNTRIVKADCRVKFETKMSTVDGISLDILQMNIDSVKQGNNLISFTYNDTLLRASFVSPLNTGTIDSVTVYYHGIPQGDPSGFGGFYFQGNYAYNLGVGFAADPHNYGRVWHPCFDNFVERATYEVSMLTNGGKTSYSNGFIANEMVVGTDSILRTWKMNEPIPTYLACVAVADYTHVNQTYNSPLYGTSIPIMLIARQSDTTNFKNSFANLENAMIAYEQDYGPYLWNKIGYVAVPFNGGAMEHASCIAYPLVTLNGLLTYETLMAHELAHHWWGNLVTCRTEGDMWINEGMASFSEATFLEHVYGYQRYINEIKKFHRTVIQQAHLDDGAFYALSGVPHSATYGTHSYKRGATIAHNMRTYMGDVAFKQGLNAIQTDYAFKDIDAIEFRDKLISSTGVNMTDFFDDWVLNPGFPAFSVDSFQANQNVMQYDVTVFVNQKLRAAPAYFKNVPLQVTFTKTDRTDVSHTIIANGQYTQATFTIPFEPAMVYLNKNEGITNAVTAENITLDLPNIINSDYSYFRLTGTTVPDSTFTRIEHHRVAPDPIKNGALASEYIISTERFWKVDGVWPAGFVGSGRIIFDARNNNSGNLDIDLMTNHGPFVFTEDSIVLFWRENTADDWTIYPDYTMSPLGSKTDGYGRIDIDLLRKGEYTFGLHTGVTSLNEYSTKDKKFSIYPNPTADMAFIDLKNLEQGVYRIVVTDLQGKTVKNEQLLRPYFWLDMSQAAKGTYLVSVMADGGFLATEKLVKK